MCPSASLSISFKAWCQENSAPNPVTENISDKNRIGWDNKNGCTDQRLPSPTNCPRLATSVCCDPLGWLKQQLRKCPIGSWDAFAIGKDKNSTGKQTAAPHHQSASGALPNYLDLSQQQNQSLNSFINSFILYFFLTHLLWKCQWWPLLLSMHETWLKVSHVLCLYFLCVEQIPSSARKMTQNSYPTA